MAWLEEKVGLGCKHKLIWKMQSIISSLYFDEESMHVLAHTHI